MLSPTIVCHVTLISIVDYLFVELPYFTTLPTSFGKKVLSVLFVFKIKCLAECYHFHSFLEIITAISNYLRSHLIIDSLLLSKPLSCV